MSSLRQLVLGAARAGIHVSFYSADGSKYTKHTWQELLDNAELRAKTLVRERLVQSNDYVIVLGASSAELVETLIAVNLSGATPIILPLPRPSAQAQKELLERVQLATQAQCIFLPPPAHKRLSQLSEKWSQLLKPFPEKSEDDDGFEYQQEAEDALIQFSSGSTRQPRGVQISQDNFCSNLKAIADGASFTKEDVVVSWLPLYHDMGFIAGLFGPTAWGLNSVLMDPMTFIRRPSRWLKAISEHRGTVSMAPNFAYEYCVRLTKERELADVDLSSWRLCWNGAEMVLASTINAFESKFASYGLKANSIVPCYGAAEGTLKITSRLPGQSLLAISADRNALANNKVEISSDETSSVVLVSVGRPAQGTTVRIVSGDDALPEWTIGEIEVSGPSVSRGYLDGPDEIFISATTYRTGDLGFLAEGELFITGRKKDLIIVDGRNILPFDVEETVRHEFGKHCRKVAAFGSLDPNTGTEKLIVAIEPSPRERPTAELWDSLKAQIVSSTGTTKIEVVSVDRIPLTTSGKVQRSKMKLLYETSSHTSITSNSTKAVA